MDIYAIIEDTIRDEDIIKIVKEQVVKAKGGDLKAARFVMQVILREREMEDKYPAERRKDAYSLKLLQYGVEEN